MDAGGIGEVLALAERKHFIMIICPFFETHLEPQGYGHSEELWRLLDLFILQKYENENENFLQLSSDRIPEESLSFFISIPWPHSLPSVLHI